MKQPSTTTCCLIEPSPHPSCPVEKNSNKAKTGWPSCWLRTRQAATTWSPWSSAYSRIQDAYITSTARKCQYSTITLATPGWQAPSSTNGSSSPSSMKSATTCESKASTPVSFYFSTTALHTPCRSPDQQQWQDQGPVAPKKHDLQDTASGPRHHTECQDELPQGVDEEDPGMILHHPWGPKEDQPEDNIGPVERGLGPSEAIFHWQLLDQRPQRNFQPRSPGRWRGEWWQLPWVQHYRSKRNRTLPLWPSGSAG